MEFGPNMAKNTKGVTEAEQEPGRARASPLPRRAHTSDSSISSRRVTHLPTGPHPTPEARTSMQTGRQTPPPARARARTAILAQVGNPVPRTRCARALRGPLRPWLAAKPSIQCFSHDRRDQTRLHVVKFNVGRWPLDDARPAWRPAPCPSKRKSRFAKYRGPHSLLFYFPFGRSAARRVACSRC
ncbi:hypothetical protein BKA80DRAFT_127604 [Phyllosticta citrichinensis]